MNRVDEARMDTIEKDPEKDAVTRHLNIWASIAHHQLAKGFGSPELMRCGVRFSYDSDPPEQAETRDGVLTKICTSSEDTYDGDKRKYKPTGVVGYPNDPKSQISGLVVECALREIGYPPLLVALLLWIYPTCGDLTPRRPRSWDPENPYRSFRPKRWVALGYGKVGEDGHCSWRHERAVDRFLQSIEREFRHSIDIRLR